MKKFAFILPLLILFSCTVQKRHYQKGYFISWNKHTSTQTEKSKQAVSKPEETPPALAYVKNTLTAQPTAFSSISEDLNLSGAKKKPAIFGANDSCDVIVYKNGTETSIKIIEINSTQIKYKKCNMPDGPIYVTDKSDIFMITYANGTKEVFKVQENTTPAPSKQQYEPGKYRSPPKKKNTALATTSLVFAILGFYPLIFIGGIIAIITASIQLYKISIDPDEYGAERKARGSLFMAIAGMIMWTLIIALIILSV